MLIDTQHTRTGQNSQPAPTHVKLTPEYRAKPWGRRDGLWAPDSAQPLGEVIFKSDTSGLVLKWLQTSEPLSVQIHPQRGPGRKHEWWYIADAKPGAYLQLGLKESATPEDIRRAAQDGSLPDMLRRIEPAVGDTFFVEAGTIHALGPGLTVVEVQEPSDVTWRLFDYGRPRELHLDQALQEAILDPQPLTPMPNGTAPFQITHEMLAPDQRSMLVAPRASVMVAEGRGSFGTEPYAPHQCWDFTDAMPVHTTEPTVLILAEPVASSTDDETLWRARK